MATSSAERQRAYRQRRPEAGDNGERRLQCWLSTSAKLALDRLAGHHGTSKRAVLERLILEADKAATSDMTDKEFDAYLSVKR